MKFFDLPVPFSRAACLCALVFAAQAQTAVGADDAAHAQQLQQRSQARTLVRQEMEQQRQQIEQRKAQEEKACWQRFAVEDCLRKVRAQERQELNLLRDRELRINSEERQDRADERLRTIERRQQQGPSPSRVQATPRHAPAPLPQTVQEAGTAAPQQPVKTEADIARELSQRQTQAQQRAAEQAERLQAHDAAQAERALSEAERRERVKKRMQQKQEAAKARQLRKADDIANRKGAPLPVPQGLPEPAAH